MEMVFENLFRKAVWPSDIAIMASLSIHVALHAATIAVFVALFANHRLSLPPSATSTPGSDDPLAAGFAAAAHPVAPSDALAALLRGKRVLQLSNFFLFDHLDGRKMPHTSVDGQFCEYAGSRGVQVSGRVDVGLRR